MMRCGYCWAPAPAEQLCTKDWEELQSLLRRCDGIDGDLASAVGRRGRHGETVSRSTAPGLPINMDAVDARLDLTGALQRAVAALLPRSLPSRHRVPQRCCWAILTGSSPRTWPRRSSATSPS